MKMARGTANAGTQCREIIESAKAGRFAPIYLLMGEESYYPDKACDAIVEYSLDESSRDFNETICYGADVDADAIATAAMRYPMMAERQLVVVKDAQAVRDIEKLAPYCEHPLDSTVLVLLFRGTTLDKRKSLYKQIAKVGVVLESPALRDYEMPGWITQYYSEEGLEIDPDAAALLAEDAGTDLSRIAVETDKLMKNLPEGTKKVTAGDIEQNIGISREFSIFELTKALSARNVKVALKVARHIGDSPRFSMPMAVSALYLHFNRILKYGILKRKEKYPDKAAIASVLQGVNPYFWKEYGMAVDNYPVPIAMEAISLLCDYDYKGKGGEVGEATPGELLTELVLKILNLGYK